MSSKKLTIGNETFDYPITGTPNYGEAASNWAEAATDAIAEFFGPGDIRTSEIALLEGQTNANIAGLSFDTAFVQRIEVQGLMTRKFTSNPTKAESFTMTGVYNGTEFLYSMESQGDDTGITLTMSGGQVQYTSTTVADTSELTIKFRARTIIDETAV